VLTNDTLRIITGRSRRRKSRGTVTVSSDQIISFASEDSHKGIAYFELFEYRSKSGVMSATGDKRGHANVVVAEGKDLPVASHLG
jgi:hypothetical protein